MRCLKFKKKDEETQRNEEEEEKNFSFSSFLIIYSFYKIRL